MGKEKAFCTSRLLSEAYANPTAFCTAQGILMHYCTGALALWFLVYTINLVQVHLSVFHSVLKLALIIFYYLNIKLFNCAVPEKIHTHPTEGHRKFLGGGGS